MEQLQEENTIIKKQQNENIKLKRQIEKLQEELKKMKHKR
jgi:hypothetical protein